MNPDSSQIDEPFMHRAIRLAMDGRGYVEPNPMVGCVIVRDNRIIGEGFHQKYGDAHAEPNALRAARDAGHSLEGATAYVTLEPCCHINKQTPPCVPALLEAKVERVVIGCIDPYELVAGRGAQQLREAGLKVDVGVLERECKQLIAPFIATIMHRRPYVTLKWAQSADGKVAGPGGRRAQITSRQATELVHDLRTRSDAIMVGIGTALADNPRLNVRHAAVIREPLKVVLDTRLRIPIESELVKHERERLEVYCRAFNDDDSHRRCALDERELHLHPIATDDRGRLSIDSVLQSLHEMGVVHLLVEPGPTLTAEMLPKCDRVWRFRSTEMRVNDKTAPNAMEVPKHWPATGEARVGTDTLTEYLNPDSDACFAIAPSADFVRLVERP